MRERHYPLKLWSFEYTIESYTPAEKRRYGYFTLPLLDGIDLAGRVDAKVHRKDGILELKSLYLENGFWKGEGGIDRLVSGLRDFAEFHKADKIEVGFVNPKSAKALLNRELR
jgi:uncharacterized protein YcaQ